MNLHEYAQYLAMNGEGEGSEGGGSEGVTNPKLTVNYVVGSKTVGSSPTPTYKYENGIIYGKQTYISMADGIVLETLVLAIDNNGETVYGYELPNFVKEVTEQGEEHYGQTASNEDNCQFADFGDGYGVTITDPTKDASLTITVA